jgi:hypothetical protein
MIGLGELGLDQLRCATMTMIESKDIAPFCEMVSKVLLKKLSGRDAIGGEDPFAQGTA